VKKWGVLIGGFLERKKKEEVGERKSQEKNVRGSASDKSVGGSLSPPEMKTSCEK